MPTTFTKIIDPWKQHLDIFDVNCKPAYMKLNVSFSTQTEAEATVTEDFSQFNDSC